MERLTISLNNDVYLFIKDSSKDKKKYRNKSHFVESCVRLIMEDNVKSQTPPPD